MKNNNQVIQILYGKDIIDNLKTNPKIVVKDSYKILYNVIDFQFNLDKNELVMEIMPSKFCDPEYNI